MSNYDLTLNYLKEFETPELFQINNYVNSLIKSKHKEYKIDSSGMPACPYCGSKIIKKNGKLPNGNQRYLCLNDKCRKSFSSNTKSFFLRSRKFEDYLHLMIEYTLDGLSIRNISTKLNIPIKTIWIWRTKILNLLSNFIDTNNPLAKLIYSDETYLKINLKGTKPKDMPRPSYTSKRNAVCHRELVCIQTIIDNNKRCLFNINGVARSNNDSLNSFLTTLIRDGSTLVTDGDLSYIGFANDKDIIHERVVAPLKFSRNKYTLAPINNLHSSFKFFISKYRGVSTKRLKGYLNLFMLNHFLSQILNGYEKINYIYESILGLDYNLSFNDINNVDFPFNVRLLYANLMKEGYFKDFH